MRRMRRLLLALIVAGPGPVFAQTVRVAVPGSPGAGASGAAGTIQAPALGGGLAAPRCRSRR
ncbi:MAG: hypothetical protein M0D55_03155 [Elusimicrobiota bacterium]|nr:MAG: hypothetical protein M0D55_03155 [Elusimicrobiota bacterium]